MTAPTLKPTGQAAVQVELLARLGLPASASPEDVDELHQAVSEYLAAAPADIRGWARAQVAALDSAYLQLTDPVGLGGSALRSPASPPSVVPGGPATPPARRDPAPAPVAEAAPAKAPAPGEVADDALGDDGDLGVDGDPTPDDLAALYAMVTPSAHEDMKPQPRRTRATAPAARPAPAPARSDAAPAPGGTNVWKALFLGLVGIAAVVAIAFGANTVVNGGFAAAAPASQPAAQASSGAPSVDLNKIGTLMETLQANPQDVKTLLALGTEYYLGMEYDTAKSWFDKVLAIDPENVQGLLASGATVFNQGDTAGAEAAWRKVLELDPDNIEANFDLGFMAFYQATPDYAKVQEYWGRVIELDPDSDFGKQAQTHLDALVMKSIIPAPDASGDAPAGPAASAAPSASAAAPAASPAASAAPSTAP